MAGTRDYLLDSTSARRAPDYEAFLPELPEIARRFVRGHDPIRELGRRCHSYSDLFNRNFRSRVGEGAAWFFLTIGEVKFRRESIYHVTEQKVITSFQRGFRPDENLGVHVWLTFEEMTIVDLTIMASLLRLGRIDRANMNVIPSSWGKQTSSWTSSISRFSSTMTSRDEWTGLCPAPRCAEAATARMRSPTPQSWRWPMRSVKKKAAGETGRRRELREFRICPRFFPPRGVRR